MKAIHILILSLASAAACFAQKETLTIGPGDMIHITVLEAADLDQHVRITDSGDAPLILGGKVRLLGLSPDEAAGAIEKKLVAGDYVLNPHVSVTVEHFAKLNVSVVGQVRSPGSYETDTPRSILDVVALAGGLTERADRRITIERRNTKEQINYFVSNNSAAALKDQPFVFPGDTVLVPKASIVYFLGDVGHPGGYPFETNDSQLTVLQGIALAGGIPPTAIPAKSLLIRKEPNGTYLEIALSLSDMQKGKKADFALKPDDMIYVPFSYLRNALVDINSILSAAAAASVYRF